MPRKNAAGSPGASSSRNRTVASPGAQKPSRHSTQSQGDPRPVPPAGVKAQEHKEKEARAALATPHTAAAAQSSVAGVVAKEAAMVGVVLAALLLLFFPYDTAAAAPYTMQCLGLYVAVRVALAVLLAVVGALWPHRQLLGSLAFLAFLAVVFVVRPSVKPVADFLSDAVSPDADTFFRAGFKEARSMFFLATYIVVLGLLVFFVSFVPLLVITTTCRQMRKCCSCSARRAPAPAPFAGQDMAAEEEEDRLLAESSDGE